jgi:hypothetical protein
VEVLSAGALLRRSNFNRRTWQPACRAAGLAGFHVADLRHTGNTLGASTGASTKELMARMGHASPRAALIYQHATPERDRALADALSVLADTEAERTRRAPQLAHGGLDREVQCSLAALQRAPHARSEAQTSWSAGWRRWDSNPRPPACK